MVATCAVVALSVLSTGTASAATPDLIVSGYTAITSLSAPPDAVQTARPLFVSAGETIAITTSIYNADTSNVAQLYLAAFPQKDASNPAPTALNALAATPSQGSCTLTPLNCSFGQLRAGNSATITVVFAAPATGTATACTVGATGAAVDATTGQLSPYPNNPLSTQAAYACYDMQWNLNGSTISDTNSTSHGDFFHWNDGAAWGSDPTNLKSTYVYNAGQGTVQDGQTLGNGNKQATTVVVPVSTNVDVTTGIPGTVADGPNVPAPPGCTDSTSGIAAGCATVTAEWSQVEVGVSNRTNCDDTTATCKYGQTYHSAFPVTITFFKAPLNLKGNTPFAVHAFQDVIGNWQFEKIATACPADPTTTSVACLIVGKGAKSVIIWNFHNGKYSF